jgi:hypothetical protein
LLNLGLVLSHLVPILLLLQG